MHQRFADFSPKTQQRFQQCTTYIIKLSQVTVYISFSFSSSAQQNTLRFHNVFTAVKWAPADEEEVAQAACYSVLALRRVLDLQSLDSRPLLPHLKQRLFPFFVTCEVSA